MKSFHKELWFNIPERMDFVNITSDVESVIKESGINNGLCLVNAMHITASVFINDDESGLHEDYKRWLEDLAPFDASPEKYHHNRTGEDNGDAHHKRQIMGREVVIAVTDGRLHFGTWEQIFYGEHLHYLHRYDYDNTEKGWDQKVQDLPTIAYNLHVTQIHHH